MKLVEKRQLQLIDQKQRRDLLSCMKLLKTSLPGISEALQNVTKYPSSTQAIVCLMFLLVILLFWSNTNCVNAGASSLMMRYEPIKVYEGVSRSIEIEELRDS